MQQPRQIWGGNNSIFNNHAQLAPPPVTLDLRVIAEHAWEGAASTDEDCPSQAVSLFISDSVACLDTRGDSVTQR